jgi:hypothetical protein
MISEIFTFTVKGKRRLVWGYVVIFCTFVATLVSWPVSVLTWCFGGTAPGSLDFSKEAGWFALVFMGALCALQAAFLWGGGRISDAVGKHQAWRNIVSVLVGGILVTLNLIGIFLTFPDWSDRFDSDRSTQYHSLFRFDEARFVLGPCIVLALISFVFLFVRTRRLSRRRALEHLIVPVIVTGWLHFAVALPSQVVVSTHLREGFLSDLTPSLLTIYVSTFELLWCMGVFAYLARSDGSQTADAEPFRKQTELKGEPYIDSAKTVASLLLVIAYFGISQAVVHASDLDAAVDARSAFAADLVRTYLSSFQPFQDWRKAEGRSAESDQIYQWLEKHLVPRIPTDIPWVETANVKVGSKANGLFSSDLSYFFVVEVREYRSDHPWVSNANIDVTKIATGEAQPFDTVREAVRSGVETKKGEDFAALYLRTENALLRKTVALPASGFSFPAGEVVSVSFLVVFVMLVLLQDRVRNVFRDPDLGRGAPWLILDAEGRLARILSQLWTLGLFVGPWILGILTVRVSALEIRSNGSTSFLIFDVLTYLALLLLIGGSGGLSLKVIGSVNQLRRLQCRPTTHPVSANLFE